MKQTRGKHAATAGQTAHAKTMKNANGATAKPTAETENATVVKTAGTAELTAPVEVIKNVTIQESATRTAETENATQMKIAKPATIAAANPTKTASPARQEQTQEAA